MLWTIFVILLVLWMLGLVSAYTMGGFIHILLVLALVAVVIQLLGGRRVAVESYETCPEIEGWRNVPTTRGAINRLHACLCIVLFLSH